MAKYLITGGAGFIGSNYLLQNVIKHPENQYVCLDNLTYASNISYLKPLMDKGNFKVLGAVIKRETLTEEQVLTLKDMIENNQAAYIVDRNIVGAIETYVYPYVGEESADWAKIAQQTAEAIESGM